jgi:hypothetical protein
MEVYCIGQKVGHKCTARTFKVKIFGCIVNFKFPPNLTIVTTLKPDSILYNTSSAVGTISTNNLTN